MMKNDSALFYTCSLIEYIGREQKQKRSVVVRALGRDAIKRIYRYADVFHCEVIAKVAEDFIGMCGIEAGDYDNVSKCRYRVPDYWTIGEVYKRLIEDVAQGDMIGTLMEVYDSWISESVSNYNSDFYYQPRDYIRECYLSGEVL